MRASWMEEGTIRDKSNAICTFSLSRIDEREAIEGESETLNANETEDERGVEVGKVMALVGCVNVYILHNRFESNT